MSDILNLYIERAGAEDIRRRPDSILCQARLVGVELLDFVGMKTGYPVRVEIGTAPDNDKLL